MAICGVKFSAYPTKEQEKILSEWIGCSRVIYNCKVEEDYKKYLEFKETGIQIPSNQAYSHFKTEEREYLKRCPSQILRNSAVNWFTAKERFFKKLAKNPKKKIKGIRDTVLITKELFTFKDEVNEDGSIKKILILGNKKFPFGILKFYAHREFGTPKQIVIGKKNKKVYISFCYENEDIYKTEEELLAEYSLLDKASLDELTIGIDRGIIIPFKTNKKLQFDISEEAKRNLKIKQKRLKKYQKRLSRQKKGSNSRNKTKAKIGKLHQKIYNIRHDFCHKTSHDLAISDAKIFAVEDLKLKNMSKAPKPKMDEKGKYLPNSRKAKAGLNRELLNKGLGKTIDLLEYKARKYGKIVVKVPPNYSSQECAICSHIHPDNRKTQSKFFFVFCGNQDNADNNAAKVIAKRGVQFLISQPKAEKRTRLGTSRSKAGRENRKTILEQSKTLVSTTPEAMLFRA